MMPPSPLTRRVQILEGKVERLEKLPARIDGLEVQILQFREEVRAEFSATRAEFLARIALTEAALLHEMNQLDENGVARDQETRRQLAVSLAETRAELIARIAEGDEETRRYLRVLHEEVIARIATIGEGGRPRR
jgi:DNA anti-recombination protein RmuC